MYAILHILSGEYFKYQRVKELKGNLLTFVSESEANNYIYLWYRNSFIISEFINDKSYNYFNVKELQIIKLSEEEIQNVKIKE